MGAFDRWAAFILVAAVLALDSGCGSTGPPAPAVPAEPMPRPADPASPTDSGPLATESVPAAPLPEPAPGEQPGAQAEPSRPRHVVIDTPGSAEPAAEPVPSLYEASVKARQERAGQGASTARVVTDETLRVQAGSGALTTASEPMVQAPEAAPDVVPPETMDATGTAAQAVEEPEIYWRRKVRDARLRWRAAAERATEIEADAARLRWEFYATDDPFRRDSQIKPAWDRALAGLEEARQEAQFEQRNLEATLEAGRREGAFPGWLREGLELEPQADEPERGLPEHDAAEPVEAEDPEGPRR